MESVKVTVFGRVKPCSKNLLSQEYRVKYGENEDYITFNSTKTTSGKKSYRFQKIFGEKATQEQVFEAVARPVIKNVLSGYNGTIFTYGQTGSGKTYTMTGDLEKWINPGLIPRTIQEIFKSKGRNTVVTITYCEIYNEHVYDLIRYDRMDSDLPQVSLLEDSTGITHFRNLSVHIVTTAYEALQLLLRGDANKMVAETTSNAKSSRSHVIFSMALDLPHPTQENLCLKPVLYLVDLAGSEKLSKCKASMTNPWETRYINLSLHYLEQVLVALRQPGRVHIPYRNSLMTALLRNSLGGNCITAMITTFSLAVDDLEETIQTCRFAERIALIKNEVKLTEIASPQKEIDILRRENEKLKAQLKLLNCGQLSIELTEDDKEKCAESVKNYLKNSDCFELPLSDIRRTEYCFWLMREEIKNRKKNSARETSKENPDIDFFKKETPVQDNCLEFDATKLVSFKTDKTADKKWRRKRNPVELPKINITYKRWKSTERLPEEDSYLTEKETANECIEKESQILDCISDHSNKIKVSSDTSFGEIPDPESHELTGCFFKEKDPDLFLRRTSSNESLNFSQDTKKEKKYITIGGSKKPGHNPIFRVMAQNKSVEGERLSFGKLRKLISIGVQIQSEGSTEREKEREIEFSEPISLDEVSIASNESSEFSTGCLPLTGDIEVDEEIIKFYKARYEMFKNKSAED